MITGHDEESWNVYPDLRPQDLAASAPTLDAHGQGSPFASSIYPWDRNATDSGRSNWPALAPPLRPRSSLSLSFFHQLRVRLPSPAPPRMSGISYASAFLLGMLLECVTYGEPRFILVVTVILAPELDRSRRHLRISLYRCLLCPVGEVFQGARTEPPSRVRYCVLWDHRHHRKQGSTVQKPHPGTHSVAYLYPVESHYLALCVNTSDFV